MPALEFGVLLRHLRQAGGLSLRAMARQIGVSPAYLSQVETGKEPIPAAPRLLQMEAALGLGSGVLTALTDRVDPRVLAVLEREPLAAELLRTTADAGFTASDYQALINRIRRRASSVGEETLSSARQSGRAVPDIRTARLMPFVTPRRCFTKLQVTDRRALFQAILEGLRPEHPELDGGAVVGLLEARERQASTAVGQGIAIPHACVDACDAPLVSIATLAGPVAFGEGPDAAVSLVFLVLSPAPQGPGHVGLLARIARLCCDAAICDALRQAPSPEALFARLRTFDQKAA